MAICRPEAIDDAAFTPEHSGGRASSNFLPLAAAPPFLARQESRPPLLRIDPGDVQIAG